MSAGIETFTFTKEVPLADADGVAIREGSVLQNISDNERGVVTWIGRKDSTRWPMLASVGDISIKTSPWGTRITNQYSEWRHIPNGEQSYEERHLAWLTVPYDHDEERSVSRDMGLAIDGIMALLPSDVVDWERGPWPDSLEDALRFLINHLNDLKKPLSTRD